MTNTNEHTKRRDHYYFEHVSAENRQKYFLCFCKTGIVSNAAALLFVWVAVTFSNTEPLTGLLADPQLFADSATAYFRWGLTMASVSVLMFMSILTHFTSFETIDRNTVVNKITLSALTFLLMTPLMMSIMLFMLGIWTVIDVFGALHA